jgi:hypothetical protein
VSYLSHKHDRIPSVFQLSNFNGPAARSVRDRHDLFFETDGLGTPGNPIKFWGGRMPLPPTVIAALVATTGTESPVVIGLVKTFIFILPLWISLIIIWRTHENLNPLALFLFGTIPVCMTPVLADVSNMQVEEGYAYSLIALCFTIVSAALLIDREAQRKSSKSIIGDVLFGVLVCLIYLTKSSLLPLCICLCMGYAVLPNLRTASRCVPILVLGATLLSWGVYQLSHSGQFSFGTSVDGMNLHKGNNPYFLQLYPPVPGTNLDSSDWQLNIGKTFSSEWEFNAYHKREALQFISSHPEDTLRGLGRKTYEFFLSTEKIGSTRATGLTEYWELTSLVLFRVCNLFGLAIAAGFVLRNRISREFRIFSGFYILTCLAAALPYLIGFAYTRHTSILIIPSWLYLFEIYSMARSSRADKAVSTVKV